MDFSPYADQFPLVVFPRWDTFAEYEMYMMLVGQRAQDVYVERDMLRAENERLVERLAGYESQVATMREQVVELTADHKGTVNDVLDEMERVVGGMDRQIADLKQQNRSLDVEVCELRVENDILMDSLVKTNNEFASVGTECVGMKEHLAQIAAECVALDAARKEFSASVAVRLAALEKIVPQTPAEAAKVDAKKARKAAKRLESLEAEVASLHHLHTAAEARAKKAEAQIEKNATRLQKAELASSTTKASLMEKEDEMRVMMIASEAARKDLRSDVRMKTLELETIRAENARLRATLGDTPMDDVLAKLQSNNEELVRRVIKAEADNKELRLGLFGKLNESKMLIEEINMRVPDVDDDDE